MWMICSALKVSGAPQAHRSGQTPQVVGNRFVALAFCGGQHDLGAADQGLRAGPLTQQVFEHPTTPRMPKLLVLLTTDDCSS